MPRTIEGNLVDQGGRYCLVAPRFNDFVTGHLIEGAIDTLVRHGASADAVTVVRCPGAFELPLVCDRIAATGRYDAVIALGCVIRGGTAHFDYVAGEAAKGIAGVATRTGVPVIFGVLTTDTLEQAIDRAGVKLGNKGGEAAIAAIEMVNLLKAIG